MKVLIPAILILALTGCAGTSQEHAQQSQQQVQYVPRVVYVNQAPANTAVGAFQRGRNNALGYQNNEQADAIREQTEYLKRKAFNDYYGLPTF